MCHKKARENYLYVTEDPTLGRRKLLANQQDFAFLKEAQTSIEKHLSSAHSLEQEKGPTLRAPAWMQALQLELGCLSNFLVTGISI